MRMAAINHRAVGLAGDRAWDIAEASGGAFGPDPMQVLANWEAFLAWAADNAPDGGDAYSADDLTCPVPRPPQVFGIGLNYADHAGESGMEVPDDPLVFTKFPSCMAAPNADVPLVPGNCDWEVELVVVIGRAGRDIAAADIADHIAGFTVGQDVSERDRPVRRRLPAVQPGEVAPQLLAGRPGDRDPRRAGRTRGIWD